MYILKQAITCTKHKVMNERAEGGIVENGAFRMAGHGMCEARTEWGQTIMR